MPSFKKIGVEWIVLGKLSELGIGKADYGEWGPKLGDVIPWIISGSLAVEGLLSFDLSLYEPQSRILLLNNV
jgi:hypothetical protein